MHKALKQSQRLVTKTWGDISFFWGINKVMGQLYALLLSHEAPLTLDDMCSQLRISRGNASMNIRALQSWGVIHKVRIKGDRKDYYRLDEDDLKIMALFVRERKKRELEPAIATMTKSTLLLRSALKSMTAAERKNAQVFLERIDRMKRIAESVDELLERFVQGETVTPSAINTILIPWKQRA